MGFGRRPAPCYAGGVSEELPSLTRAASILREAGSLLFITGAGISADSGLPTYRGIGGLYEESETEDGLAIEDALSGPMFARDPGLVWKYIRQIEQACRGASPNAAHRQIAALEGRLDRVWVLTQNVDGLHRAAGSQKVIDIHGDVHHLHCTVCDWEMRVPDYAELAALPRCPRCTSVVRPRVVLFGEMLPPLATADYEREMGRGFDAIVSVGTSALFPYIYGPIIQAARTGIPTIDINPGQSAISQAVDVHLKMGAAEAMAALAERLGG